MITYTYTYAEYMSTKYALSITISYNLTRQLESSTELNNLQFSIKFGPSKKPSKPDETPEFASTDSEDSKDVILLYKHIMF